MTAVRILRAADHTRMPWRNGGGVTSEIARLPPDGDFDWRISIADVATGGPFSAFDGIDRVILRIGAAPLLLTVDGVEHDLPLFHPLAFPGDIPSSATLPAGPTRDLNIMTRRGHCSASVEVIELSPSRPLALTATAHTFAIILADTATLNAELDLTPDDAIHLRAPENATLTGSGTLLLAHLTAA